MSESREFKRVTNTKGIYTVQLKLDKNYFNIIIKKESGYIPVKKFIEKIQQDLIKKLNELPRNNSYTEAIIHINDICNKMIERYVGKIDNKKDDKNKNKDYGFARSWYGNGLPNGFKIIFKFNLLEPNQSVLLTPVNNLVTGKNDKITLINGQDYYTHNIKLIFKILLYQIYSDKIFENDKNTENFLKFYKNHNLI